jgi:hypothetical protein
MQYTLEELEIKEHKTIISDIEKLCGKLSYRQDKDFKLQTMIKQLY